MLPPPGHRIHIYAHIDNLTGPKSMTSMIELQAHYSKYIVKILHRHHSAVYCDTSTDSHGTAGTGVIITKVDLKEKCVNFQQGKHK